MTAPAPVLGLILAGGGGTRMNPDGGGADKALVTLAGRPLLAHVMERLAPQCAAVALNAAGDPARFAAFSLNVIPDDPDTAGLGPLAGILAGLDFAALAGFDRIVTAPVDTPFLPADYVARLVAMKENRPGAQIVCAETHRRAHYVCGLFPVALRHGLRTWLASGGRRVSQWVDSQAMARAPFDIAEGAPDPFLNINTPEDLAAAENGVPSPPVGEG
jgi:molybdopterin-guanine dinucleotide biosynthesis protein A